MEPHRLFLTRAQAMHAICIDFKGYGPQPMLFCEVLRALHQGRVAYQREPGKEGLWISMDKSSALRWLEGEELIEFMCKTVTEAKIDPDCLASLCRLVFQASCRAGYCPHTNRQGVYIHTGMDGFRCRQCGHCCTRLNYQDGITEEDVRHFEALGREDVLKWVGTAQTVSGETAYRIWVIPGTNQFASACPFLRNGPAQDRKVCSIHEIKPQVCRNYPLSRKHARMTGCPGFDR